MSTTGHSVHRATPSALVRKVCAQSLDPPQSSHPRTQRRPRIDLLRLRSLRNAAFTSSSLHIAANSTLLPLGPLNVSNRFHHPSVDLPRHSSLTQPLTRPLLSHSPTRWAARPRLDRPPEAQSYASFTSCNLPPRSASTRYRLRPRHLCALLCVCQQPSVW